MINQFDSANYPDTEPTELTAGTRWAWTRSDITAVYATDTYTLKYKFLLQASDEYSFTVTASKVSAAHVVEVAIAANANHIAGSYLWKAIVVRDSDSEEVVVDDGMVEILPQSGEVRSHVYIVLQAIQATIQGKATKDQLSYTVNGRTLNRYSFEDLRAMEKDYRIRWNEEKRALGRKAGRSGKHRVLIKMGA